jgi:DNA repair protein RecO (recombination protein O)
MESVDAFVLHARPYRETSQLLELLTAEQGRIGLLVRGSRGAKRSNPLQPFRCYRIVLAGRGELRRSQSVEAVDAPRLLGGHVLFAALYLNELLVRLLFRDVPVPDVFALYRQALDALARGDAIELTLRRFEKQLLDELGYGHRYGETVAGEPVLAGALYTFDIDRGVRAALPGSEPAQCFRGSALLALDAGEFVAADDLRDAKRLMRCALAPHLGDKPLNSRELFRPVRDGRANEIGE